MINLLGSDIIINIIADSIKSARNLQDLEKIECFKSLIKEFSLNKY